MKKCIITIALLLFSLSVVMAQQKTPRLAKPFVGIEGSKDTTAKSPVDFHLNLGTQVMTGGGNTSSLFWISPDISYQISPKVILRTGFTYGADLLGKARNFPQSNNVRSLAPLEKPKNDFVSVYGRAEFMPSNRFWIATTFSYQSGLMPNPYYPSYLSTDADIFSFNAEMQYKITEKTFLYLNIGVSHIDYPDRNYNLPGFDNSSAKSFGLSSPSPLNMRNIQNTAFQ